MFRLKYCSGKFSPLRISLVRIWPTRPSHDNLRECYPTGRKRRGARPCHFEKGSSSIARFILKSLEQLKLVETVSSGYEGWPCYYVQYGHWVYQNLEYPCTPFRWEQQTSQTLKTAPCWNVGANSVICHFQQWKMLEANLMGRHTAAVHARRWPQRKHKF